MRLSIDPSVVACVILVVLVVEVRWTFCADEFFSNFLTEYFDNRLKLHKFARLRTPELIKYRGYPAEIHHIITTDGYILEAHRIPHGIKGIGADQNITKPPVLIYHGGAQSSVDWVLNEKLENCLGFLLADAGYDVWLGNFRGNTYSDKHTSLNLRNRKFWDFTPEQIGVYDLTASIDYILKASNQSRIHYIGFSLGTTIFFGAMSERPEYNEKIKLGVLLGVTAYQHHSIMLRLTCRFLGPILEAIRRIYGPFPIPGHLIARAIHTFIPHICNPKTVPVIPDICWLFWSLGWGFDNYQIPKDDVSLLLSKLPTSSSSKTFIHVCSNVNGKRFGKFDYGSTKNTELYGFPLPPAYNLSKITAPVSMYTADGDLLCVLEDIQRARNELSNVVDFYRVPNDDFNHVDFTYGKDVHELVYKHVLEVMGKY